MSTSFVYLDTETTGGSFQRDRIIEIGAIRFENGKQVGIFHSLINPRRYLPSEIIRLTGIQKDELEKASPFYHYADTLFAFLQDAILVAHNAGFDYSFLKREFKEAGMHYAPDILCTVKLSRKLFPRYTRHNLDAIVKRFNISVAQRHRALDDAKALIAFLEEAEKQVGKETVMKAMQSVVRQRSLPPHLPRTALEELPESPGIYIMYAKEGCPLYIGKSINIKERVLSHCYAVTQSDKEFTVMQQVATIEAIQTTGDLGAQLLELKFIKQLKPLYNKRSRQQTSHIVLSLQANQDGYYSIQKKSMGAITANELANVLGIFSTDTKAKDFLHTLVKEYQLCEKLLGLQKGASACFNYQLNLCKGACIKKERKEAYNVRFITAFHKTKISRWPFAGPIVITESNEFGDRSMHVFNNWCYGGSTDGIEDLDDILVNRQFIFDQDMYHIVKRFTENGKNQKYITIIPSESSSIFRNAE